MNFNKNIDIHDGTLSSTWQCVGTCCSFIGSEESILEYPAESTTVNTTNTLALTHTRPTGALVDLIRSRDFVIDFPRVFVLEGNAETRTNNSLFPNGIPERSQSTMGLAQAKDWMSTVANKLDEQHGFRHPRKDSQKMEMHENLLTVRQDSMKMRRSHSTEGRYCVRKDIDSTGSKPKDGEPETEGACGGCSTSNSSSTSRRNSSSAFANQFNPSQTLKFDILNRRRKSSNIRRNSDVALEAGGNPELQSQRNEDAKTPDQKLPNIIIHITDEDFK